METSQPVNKNLLVVSLFVHDMKAPLSIVGSGAKKLTQDMANEEYNKIGADLAEKINMAKKDANLRLNAILDMDSTVDLACDIPDARDRVSILSRIVSRVRKNKGASKDKPNLCNAIYDLKDTLTTMMELIDAFEIQADYAGSGHKGSAVLNRMKRNAKIAVHLAENAIAILVSHESNVIKETCQIANIVHPAILEIIDLLDPDISDSTDHTIELKDLQQVISSDHIYMDIDESVWRKDIVCDQEKVSQVIVNLLLNAMKFRKKELRLGVYLEKKDIVFSVTDDGKGIPKEDQPFIFQNRFQVKSEKAFPIRGHGIGLAGAQALLESMNGELCLQSSSGEKTCFKAMVKNLG